MSIKPALFFIVSVNIKRDGGKRIHIPLPIPMFLILSLAMSAEEIIDLALLFCRGKHRKRLKLFKAQAMVIKLISIRFMFTIGRYDFVLVDAGDKEERVKIKIYSK